MNSLNDRRPASARKPELKPPVKNRKTTTIRVPERNSLAEAILLALLDGSRPAPSLAKLLERQNGRKPRMEEKTSVTMAGLVAMGMVTIEVALENALGHLDETRARVRARVAEASAASATSRISNAYRLTKLGEVYAEWVKERRRLESHNTIRPNDLVHASKWIFSHFQALIVHA